MKDEHTRLTEEIERVTRQRDEERAEKQVLAQRLGTIERALEVEIRAQLPDGPCWCTLGGRIERAQVTGQPLPEDNHSLFCLAMRENFSGQTRDPQLLHAELDSLRTRHEALEGVLAVARRVLGCRISNATEMAVRLTAFSTALRKYEASFGKNAAPEPT